MRGGEVGLIPNVYILEDAQISEMRQVRSKIAAAQLITIETQLIEPIFTPKFATVGLSSKNHLLVFRDGGQHN